MSNTPKAFDENNLSEIIKRVLSEYLVEVNFSDIIERASPIYFDEKKVSKITGRALPTLRNDRHNRRGIPYYKIGRSVRYALSDVIAFMESQKILPEDNMWAV